MSMVGPSSTNLQKLYPEIFKEVRKRQVRIIDPSVKIKQWEVKYFNLVQTSKNVVQTTFSAMVKLYFTVNDKGTFLPAALTGDTKS